MKKILLYISLFLVSCTNAQLLGVIESEGGGDSVPIIDTGLLLSNFHIEDANKDRIYFDSSEILTGTTFTGFTVNGKILKSLVVNTGQLTGHYFTTVTAFTYWDTNTIRYEGNNSLPWITGQTASNIQDANSNALLDFSLTYIQNNINEPAAPNIRYVTSVATGGGNGLTEGTAWTITEAMGLSVRTGEQAYTHSVGLAVPGMTVYIKAGDYGNDVVNLQQDGTATNPTKFIGYKITPGDITSNYWDYTTNTQGDYATTWDTSEMPTFTGSNPLLPLGREAIQLRTCSYIILKNLQISNHYMGIRANGSDNEYIVIERVNGMGFGGSGDSGASFIFTQAFTAGAQTPYLGNNNYKVKDCRAVNAGLTAISLYGEGGHLLDGNKTYCDVTTADGVMDYHQAANKHNNVIINCHAENFNSTTTFSSHGIGIRGGYNLDNDYNLIVDCTAINVVEGLYIRNFGCDYNVIKDSYVGNNTPSTYRTLDRTGGVYLWGGITKNLVERVKVEDCWDGFVFRDIQGEDNLPDTTIGNNNLIRNCIVNRVNHTMRGAGSTNSDFSDNEFINCTFNDGNIFYTGVETSIVNLRITNSLITNHDSATPLADNTGFVFTNTNFFGNVGNWTETGTNITNLDPYYVNESNGELKLTQSTNPLITEGSTNEVFVEHDYDYSLRTAPYSIGAFEYDGVYVAPPVVTEAYPSGDPASIGAREGTSTANWTGTAVTFTSDTETPTDGTHVVKLASTSGGDFGNGYIDIPIEDTKIYNVSIWVNKVNATDPVFYSWTGISGFSNTNITGTGWQEYNWTLTATETGFCRIKLRLGSTINPGEYILLDKISFDKTN